jgi:citrate lyase beta subunit
VTEISTEEALFVKTVRQWVDHAVRAVARDLDKPTGIANAEQTATSNCRATLMGANDALTIALGGLANRSRDRRRDPDMRRHTVRHAAAADLPVIDSPTVLLDDGDVIADEAPKASRAGRHAKACLAPRQALPVGEGLLASATCPHGARSVLGAVALRQRQPSHHAALVWTAR